MAPVPGRVTRVGFSPHQRRPAPAPARPPVPGAGHSARVDGGGALCYISHMPRSPSGRVVVEIDPELKAELYSVLALERLTLRAWLTREASAYVRTRGRVLKTDELGSGEQ